MVTKDIKVGFTWYAVPKDIKVGFTWYIVPCDEGKNLAELRPAKPVSRHHFCLEKQFQLVSCKLETLP